MINDILFHVAAQWADPRWTLPIIGNGTVAKVSESEQASLIFNAMGNPRRLQILQAIKNGEMSVQTIADTISLEQSATSQHLARLRQAGLVFTRRQAQTVFYRLSSPQVADVIESAVCLINMRQVTPAAGDRRSV